MPLASFHPKRPPWLRSFHREAIQRIKPSAARSLPVLDDVLTAIACVAFLTALLTVPFTQPIGWMPKASEAHELLGPLLGAQAAITALTLAVTLFVMQGVSTRQDADDRIYAEYIRRSQVRVIFWSSAGAVFVTGTVLTTEALVGDTGKIAAVAPGVVNLVLVAAGAFVANLILTVKLFERALRLTKPQIWRELRQDVNKRDVRQAIEAFLGRLNRVAMSRATNKPDITTLFRDAGEGSADQAIQALLDDARRAMSERRLEAFTSSLDSIKELITYAMDEIEKIGITWGPPGSRPEWPPLRELQDKLYLFREEVIREGTREYVFELLGLDHWLVSSGIVRSCGELFTAGLSGYRWNYQISTRSGSGEYHDLLRDRFNSNLDALAYRIDGQSLISSMAAVIGHQERMLSDAIHANRPEDYKRLHEAFNSSLPSILRRQEMNGAWSHEAAALRNRLSQQYRIALMGLAGRAAALADSSRITDPSTYISVAREAYANIRQLADDITVALDSERQLGFSLWSEWEMREQTPGQGYASYPEQFPQTFFAIRAMELADDSAPSLNLQGNGKQVLEWFVANSERLKHFVEENPNLTVERRRELAIASLQGAVRNDELAEENEIIERGVSDERVAAFASKIRENALSNNYIEQLFQQAGRFTLFAEDAQEAPSERGYYELLPKAPFMEPAENDRTHYSPIEGEQWGLALSSDAVRLLCESLGGTSEALVLVESHQDLLNAIGDAADDLALTPGSTMVIVLAGDWEDIGLALYSEESEQYVPFWRLTDRDPSVVVGRYRDHPILRGPASGEPRIYVVDPGTWGEFVSAPFADRQPLRVEVKAISRERAQEMLKANPTLFEDTPDHDSKLRKLQTYVDVAIAVRHRFTVADQSRARKIVQQSADSSDAP